MTKEQREMAPDLLSRLTELLGLSARKVRRKLRWGRLLILVPTETEQDRGWPKSENAQLIHALRERVGALEQRLDRAEAERRQLLQEADAERTMLLQAIVEANKSKWPGLWAWLKHLWLGETTKSDRADYGRQSPV